ncbi:MAG: protein translocase subunit SecD [Planctomycetes bacterium]|nr:protein translocase subunit SecD [Planctomycetota bacterium]
MGKNLVFKNVMILGLVIVAAWTLYPASKTLKPGLDLAGGTSLVYEIDTYGMSNEDKKDLSQNMITVLRRRIDPTNIQNLIWRPQGNTRFEIQMPLASKDARTKRQKYETIKQELLSLNVNPAKILRSAAKTGEQRNADFATFSGGSEDKLMLLNNLASNYDEYTSLRKVTDNLSAELKRMESALEAAGFDLGEVKLNVVDWSRLESAKLGAALNAFPGVNLLNIATLKEYVNVYGKWSKLIEQLLEPETGKKDMYLQSKLELDKLSLTEEQLNLVSDMEIGTIKRGQAIEELKLEFPDRSELIDKTIAAFDDYYPFRGGLDDPKDLQRMLKGAGILEFRIIPTTDRTELSIDEIETYVNNLQNKGPKFASSSDYIWSQIEKKEEWQSPYSIVASFGDKYYVLASNKSEEVMLHGGDAKSWKLKKAEPGTEYSTGKRAINFVLDERGGKIFSDITGNNIGRPLCISLDGLAISAPNINSKIYTRGQITGNYTEVELRDLINKLRAGSLPARLIEQPISVKTIGPSIGAENRDKGVYAGLIGFAVVIGCILVYYLLSGVIAGIALLINLLFILAVMAVVNATFTLPGIAGIILTIGMSVDANVLIFERIREEIQKGASIAIAIKNGYQKAFRTILDANITTFITAAILFWVASEEIKGFAIVLMLGIMSSMFTALFVTRANFDLLLSRGIIKKRLYMMRLIKKPNINWMALSPVFFVISTILVVGGLFIFLTRDDAKNNKYDIEFTGGTSVQINLKEGITLTRSEVVEKIHQEGMRLNNSALMAANVYSIGKANNQYEITTTETNKTTATITFTGNTVQTVDGVRAAIGEMLTNLIVTQSSDNSSVFTIGTSQTNKSKVKDVLANTFADVAISEPEVEEVVNNAILNAFGDILEIRLNLKPTIVSTKVITEDVVEAYPELSNYVGGVSIVVNLEKAVTAEQIGLRFKDLRFKPDMHDLNWYSYEILNPDLNPISTAGKIDSFAYVSVEPEAGFRKFSDDEWSRFIQNEKRKILGATRLETSLPRVTQINPSVGAEAKTRALIAIILSLFAIVTYIWVRFGSMRYGIAAIVALVHDVTITLGAVTACTYIAPTAFGRALLIGDFKINLAIVAAFLTLIGYSLNDTIVVFDRIRENRHKARLTPQTISNSINQTLSRTLLTSFTTFIVVLIMYIFGGPALRGFTFAIGFGIIIGTYSSIAIAAPILSFGTKNKKTKTSK